MKPKPIRNLVCISDTHIGCKLGLCHPNGVPLDEGGHYYPSRLQNVVWGWWEEFWKWVPKATHGEPYDLVHNGDVIDGVHHNSTTQISHNIEDQSNMAVDILRPYVEKCKRQGGTYYHVRGTEAHVGKSGSYEERIAKELGAKPNIDRQHARYELWKKTGDHLIHFLHHIGTTSSSAHESSAVNAELAAEFVEAARWNERKPTCIIRSHRHRAIELRLPTEEGYCTAAVTPAWQLKSAFCFKVAGARLSPPQIGGMVIRLDDMGHLYTNTFVRNIKRDKPE